MLSGRYSGVSCFGEERYGFFLAEELVRAFRKIYFKRELKGLGGVEEGRGRLGRLSSRKDGFSGKSAE
jgi:hypothetical protein